MPLNVDWAKLMSQQLDCYPEHYAKRQPTSYGFDVHKTEASNHVIDPITRNKDEATRYA